MIHWYETTKKGFTIHHTPMSVAEPFQKLMQHGDRSWIFTSATLAVANDFSHFAKSLGLAEATTVQYSSPFDYQQQSLCYLPRQLCDPAHPDYHLQLAKISLDVINICQGRTLFLCTSYRAMHQLVDYLSSRLRFPLLMQGTKPKPQLIKEFVQQGNAVLLATASFWEGVDISGDALSCVIIDKLPFAAPNDPVLQERLRQLKRQGQQPFFDYQLPSAVISLRQGVGRLIRTVNDKGIVVLADPRLLAKEYARAFWQSLPPIPITRDRQRIADFMQRLSEE